MIYPTSCHGIFLAIESSLHGAGIFTNICPINHPETCRQPYTSTMVRIGVLVIHGSSSIYIQIQILYGIIMIYHDISNQLPWDLVSHLVIHGSYPIGSMVLLYLVTWIPSIYPSHVSIYTMLVNVTFTIIYHHLPSFTIIYHHLPSFTIIYHHLPSFTIYIW